MQSFSSLIEHWQRFWFEKEPPYAICIYRILFGICVLETALVEIAPNFSYFYGQKAIIDIGTISARWWGKNPVFDLFLLVPQKDTYLISIFALFVIAAFCLTLGLFTRLSSILVYLGLLSIDRQCAFVLDGGDDLMRLSALILCFSNAGALYSIDRILAKKNNRQNTATVPLVKPWAQRLLQIQLAVAYFYAFLNKAVGPQWQEGSAIYYVSRLDDFVKWMPSPITDFWPLSVFLNYATLVIEFSLAVFVWFKPLRYWILLGGLMLHLGIDTCLNLPGFQWLFIISYVLFIYPSDIRTAINRLKGWAQKFIGIRNTASLENK